VFRALPLARFGLEWVEPDLPLAQPMPDGSAAVLSRSVVETAESLGVDGDAYRRLVDPFLGRWADLSSDVLGPPLPGVPDHPLLLARFGLLALLPATMLVRGLRAEPARALIAGLAAHAIAPLTAAATGGVALLFAVAAHEVGWPIPRGGSQAISDALAGYLTSLGSEVVTGRRIGSLSDLPPARAYLLDVAPEGLTRIAGDRLGAAYRWRLRAFRHGPAAFKIDYALSAPVPWTAEACRRAGTVHVGASFGEIAGALTAVSRGEAPDPPFLITAQPSLFDSSRAPEGKHVLWAYAHVPFGWEGDLTSRIEAQIERFAPGFRDLVLARATAGPPELEARDENYVGGDIAVGRFGGLQAVARPVPSLVPYATGDPAVYLCSSATPPGPGVHGMCGYHAAHAVLRRVFRAGRRTGGVRKLPP
jgi:phytoene dehydrogenase-like protein